MKKLCASTLCMFFFASSFSARPADADVPLILQAGMAALGDYEARLDVRKKNEEKSGLANYVFEINNYDIGLSESRDHYVVVIRLRKNEEGMEVGGATYWVDKKSMEIANAVGFK
ncbi:MAG: hypothetical protein WAZ48_08325 [Lysobacteraceae bacterium]